MYIIKINLFHSSLARLLKEVTGPSKGGPCFLSVIWRDARSGRA